jgi:hypothetical protein
MNDDDVRAAVAQMGQAPESVPVDVETPFVDTVAVASARNAREMGHWLLGRLDASPGTRLLCRVAEDQVAGVAAVLLEAGYGVQPHSSDESARTRTLEVFVVE